LNPRSIFQDISPPRRDNIIVLSYNIVDYNYIGYYNILIKRGIKCQNYE